MISHLTLSQRLSLLFSATLVLCMFVACGVQLYSSKQYGDAMVQRLSAGLAQQIVSSEPLLDNQGKANTENLKSLFDRLMTLNPSVELYVVSPQGHIVADAAPVGHMKRQTIDLTPLNNYLSGAAFPVYGDDPRSLDQRKVFSVAPILLNGTLHSYLYIILQGEDLNALANTAWHKALTDAIVGSLLLALLFGALAWWLVKKWVTRPVEQLTSEVNDLEQDSISAIKSLAARPINLAPENEVELLRNTFIELSRKIASQWDQLADSDRQRREFIANISHDLRTPLTSLLGYLETLSLKSATLSAEEQNQYLAIALRQGQKVRHLSQQLFELARLEHGGLNRSASVLPWLN
jgi:Osmosensitive K+ channel histidine kinase